MLVVNKATGWLVLGTKVDRKRARDYMRVLATAKNKHGLNKLNHVKGEVVIDGKDIVLPGSIGDFPSIDIPKNEQELMAL